MTLTQTRPAPTSAPVTRPPLAVRMRRRLSAETVVALGVLVVLGYLILGPLVTMLRATFVYSEQDTLLYPDAVEGALTTAHWRQMFGPMFHKTLLEPLLNSLLIAVTTSVLALTIGGILAWLMARTDIPGRKWLQPLLMTPYMLPSFALALVWLTVFKD